MNRDERLKWMDSFLRTVPPKRESATTVADLSGYLVAGGSPRTGDGVRAWTPGIITVYGSNTGIGATTEGLGAVGGPFAYPVSTGSRLEVVSASGSDTAAGTGMRTIRVVFEKTNGEIGSEDLTLNGTGAVASTATDIVYVYPQFCHGLTFGGGGAAAGNVDIRIHGGGSVIERILAGRKGTVHSGRTRVPPGYTGFIFDWSVGIGGTNTAAFHLNTNWDHKTHTHLASHIARYQLDAVTSGWFAYDLPAPMVLPEKTEIELSAVRLGGSDAAGAATFDLMLARNY